jgi:hypothetical protein
MFNGEQEHDDIRHPQDDKKENHPEMECEWRAWIGSLVHLRSWFAKTSGWRDGSEAHPFDTIAGEPVKRLYEQ